MSTGERELVEKSRPPALRSLTDSQLATLVKRMRIGRDKARTLAERQRREMRGKAKARGAKPAQADEGSRLKLSVLSTALSRLDAETKRRSRAEAKKSIVESAKKALALKQKAGRAAATPKPTPRAPAARSGRGGKERIVVENHVPPSARGRVRKQTARVQAKRDSRPK